MWPIIFPAMITILYLAFRWAAGFASDVQEFGQSFTTLMHVMQGHEDAPAPRREQDRDLRTVYVFRDDQWWIERGL